MAFINADFKRAQQHGKSNDYPAQYTDYYKLRDQTLLSESGERRTDRVVGGGGGGMEQGVEEKGSLSEDKTYQTAEAKKGEIVTKMDHDDKDREGGLRVKMKNILRRKSRDETGEVGRTDGGDDGVVR